MKWRVALAAIIKDEADYIVDWICYHLSLGVEQFFIYDNGSTDNTRGLLTKFINGGLVTFIAWPMRGGQVDAYSHAVKLLSGNAEWVGFLDVDEFVVLHQHDDMHEFLSSFDADQILVPWRNFPYSGHNSAPGGASLENFFWAYRIGPEAVTQVKHFVRPEAVDQVTAHFSFIKGERTRLPTGEPHRLSHAIANPSYAGAQINHYATRSFAENQARLRKGQVSGSSHKRLDDFIPMSAGLAERMDYDDSILRHLARFKEERADWANVADYPHRFGLKQRRPVLTSYHNVIFYLAKSFANYLTDQPDIKPLAEIPFIQTQLNGNKVNLAPILIGCKRPIVYFDISNHSYLQFFQGTIHYGDFVRRFGFDCFASIRSANIAISLSQSIATGAGGFLAVADIETENVVSVEATRSVGDRFGAKELIPPGRHCAILYIADLTPDETSVNITVQGPCMVRELLLGRLP